MLLYSLKTDGSLLELMSLWLWAPMFNKSFWTWVLISLLVVSGLLLYVFSSDMCNNEFLNSGCTRLYMYSLLTLMWVIFVCVDCVATWLRCLECLNQSFWARIRQLCLAFHGMVCFYWFLLDAESLFFVGLQLSGLENFGLWLWAKNQTLIPRCNVWYTDCVLEDGLRENLTIRGAQ